MKKLSLILLLGMLSLSVYAQRRNEPAYDQEKLEAAKIAFITQRLDIKPDQATKFWPLYNQFEEKRRNIFKKMRSQSRVDKEDLTDEKAQELIASKLATQQELLDLEKEYIAKFAKALSPKQAYLLQEADRDFVRHLYRMNRDMRREEPREETN
ncbi:hypothetical protein IFO69_00755 [Echinicola sp. CAU 1574]|uniref:LTXXQ motif family protein n=1 Tax=Echinicola arenosa TaxID=2774144 RepID=A0ABR9AH43_9BACT|nr:Spy/CpxP family protein refolding chaperone [Echinicola arenosa]MBD8487265.1 hypothetical protein [Echinicola arenosa]